VLESILQYAMDTSDASVEKLAFSVLNKMVMVWTPTGAKVVDAGFQEAFTRFVIEDLSRICFDVPSKSTFNSSDAQARLVAKCWTMLIPQGPGRNCCSTEVHLPDERRRALRISRQQTFPVNRHPTFNWADVHSSTTTDGSQTIQKVFYGIDL
jgi:hypothetical protein